MADVSEIRRCLKAFDFETLFIEVLGWDRHRAHLDVEFNDDHFSLDAVAEKRGFQVFLCRMPEGQEFPTPTICNRIQRQVAKTAHENLIVFVDDANTKQSWKWAKREKGRLLRSRGADYHKGQSGEALAQRLSILAITLEDEEREDFSLVDVNQRIRAAFDVDRVTRQFYGRFRDEHQAFLSFIKGITAAGDQEWYASLMLNRLMFVYFIQKKGFLDGDLEYLQNRLQQTKDLKGKDKFHSFYRYFLLRLFHEGFGQRESERSADLESIIGTVPYLNGGLFDVHELEHDNPHIQVADEAFERLFEFFDQYQWHLDDRPLRDDTEINPDVLGYIFEKYINQKQMGAYYTKEDITDYISKNTIIPYLFDAAAGRCPVGLQTGAAAWQLLADNPDRYIYDAIGHGIFVDIRTNPPTRLGAEVPLPPEIEAGIADISKRDEWNSPAPPDLALPTETWREHIARRQRCLELRKKLADGEVTSINDLITLNLDILQFAQDVIDNCEGPDLLRAIYYTIAGRLPQKSNEHFQRGISVLDPTCGSGAFLFAALNILQPLYEACLNRMDEFVQEADQFRPVAAEDALDALIALGESGTLEFKSTARYDVRLEERLAKVPAEKRREVESSLEKGRTFDILKAVSAMLNTEGGELLIGVQDDGSGFGIHHDYKYLGKKPDRDGYELWLTDLFTANFGKIVARCIKVSFAPRDGVDVCRLSIAPAPEPAYLMEEKAKKLYIRIGNSSRDLEVEEIITYHQQRFAGPPPVQTLPASATVTAPANRWAKTRHAEFRKVLDDAKAHPSRTYFILKSIIINNLFGVDIMAEAVEICKLRLFLRLVSTIERVDQLEPLPDIDFNIRSGNTLIGYTTLAQVEKSLSPKAGKNASSLGMVDEEDEALLAQIQENAQIVDRKFKQFRLQQTELGGAVSAHDKAGVRDALVTLTDELNKYLAADYGLDATKPRKYQPWLQSHQPFHWFAEFYGIMADRGFDVIIGNPPYVEYSKVRTTYKLSGFSTAPCGNLYAYVLERSLTLINRSGRLSLIVPLSFACTERTATARDLFRQGSSWFSSFDIRPSSLFEGVAQRLTIVIHSPQRAATSQYYSGGYRRWSQQERLYLMSLTQYVGFEWSNGESPVSKVSQPIEVTILGNLAGSGARLGGSVLESAIPIYVHRISRYFIKAMDFVPHFRDADGNLGRSEDYKPFHFDATHRESILCFLNSSLFYWFWRSHGDGFHCGYGDVYRTPWAEGVSTEAGSKLAEIAVRLMEAYQMNSVQKSIRTKKGEIIYQEFTIAPTKPVLNEIDSILGDVFALTDEAVDFIINYDFKYRIGQSDEGPDN